MIGFTVNNCLIQYRLLYLRNEEKSKDQHTVTMLIITPEGYVNFSAFTFCLLHMRIPSKLREALVWEFILLSTCRKKLIQLICENNQKCSFLNRPLFSPRFYVLVETSYFRKSNCNLLTHVRLIFPLCRNQPIDLLHRATHWCIGN